jgi:uncharacterized protein YaiE (UPF0345 family)
LSVGSFRAKKEPGTPGLPPCGRIGITRDPMSSLPTQFDGVTVHTKANVYHDGNVVSHTVLATDKLKRTLGLIRPGSYHFATGAAEKMEIVAGECAVTVDGSAETRRYGPGSTFVVPGQSGFTIAVGAGLCEYICTFLPVRP